MDIYEDILSTPIDDDWDRDGDDVFSEMAAVGGGFESIRLAIRGSEGMIPHFHFYKEIGPKQGIANDRAGGGCICFKKAEYFAHGSHTETMNRNEVIGLHKFLEVRDELGISNWKYMIRLWNDNNSERTQLPLDLPIPEYQHNMPNYK